MKTKIQYIDLVKVMVYLVLGKLPPALILTLIRNQTLILTGGQFSSGAIFRTPVYLFPEVLLYTNNTINLTNKNFFFFNIFEGLFLYKPFFNVSENPIYIFIKSNGAVNS